MKPYGSVFGDLFVAFENENTNLKVKDGGVQPSFSVLLDANFA